MTNPACSFCGKDQKEIANLIAGPTALICNECVGLCVNLIDEESRCESLSVARYLRRQFPDRTPDTVTIRELVDARLQEVGAIPAKAADTMEIHVRREPAPHKP